MSKEDISDILIKNKLAELRNEIMEFAKAANDCSIIMASDQSELVGEIKGSLNHGALVTNKIRRIEYDGSIELYDKFKRKLLQCNCSKS